MKNIATEEEIKFCEKLCKAKKFDYKAAQELIARIAIRELQIQKFETTLINNKN